MATSETRWGTGENAEAIQAWDGPLFDTWLRFRHIVTTGLGAHGDAALALVPPQPGQRVLDIGCGLGDTTQQIAGIVGASGEAVGVDAAERFIETATAEAAEAGVENARFLAADVQTDPLGGPYDMAFSRMGTMFFISPVAAMRNVCKSLTPGGKLAMVVWRRREDNLWVFRAQQIVEGIVQKPEEYDEPTCGPGPFSMAGADTTSDILVHSGFTDISLPAATSNSWAARPSTRQSTSSCRLVRRERSCGFRATVRPTCFPRWTQPCARASPSTCATTARCGRRRPPGS